MECLRVTHEPGAFARRKSARILALLRDEDFRAVLVVAGAEGAGSVFLRDKAEAETVSGGLVLPGVILEVLPQVVGERVFVRHVGVEDAFELRPFGWEFGELEVAPRLEPDEENALAVLRHHAPGVNDLVINGVAKLLGERAVDDLKGAALVMPLEVLDVLQHKGGRLVEADDAGEVEEEVALLLVLETMLAAEAELLGHAGDAERLAGKAGAEDVELRDVGDGYVVDVAVRCLSEVGGVGDLRMLVTAVP